MQFQRIVADGKQAVVEMRYHSDIYLVVKRLQSANLDPGVVVMASNIEPKIITEKYVVGCRMKNLRFFKGLFFTL